MSDLNPADHNERSPAAGALDGIRVVDLSRYHPHLADRGQILNMDHPKAGRVPMQGFSVRFGSSPMRLRHSPPMLGEHTTAILTEWLAMTPERITELRECGAV